MNAKTAKRVTGLLLALVIGVCVVYGMYVWLITHTVRDQEELLKLSRNVRRLRIPANSCNDEELKEFRLSGYKNVVNAKTVVIDSLDSLTLLEFGMNSFTQHNNGYGKDTTRSFILTNCYALKRVVFDRFAFSDFSGFVMENLDALEKIEFGVLERDSYNFHYASLQLMNLPSLRFMEIGFGSFDRSSKTILNDLPSLKEVKMNEGGLYCVMRSLVSEKLIEINTHLTHLIYPSNTCNNPSITSFSIDNYPFLESIEVGDDCFMYVNTVLIKNADSLKLLKIGNNSFTNHEYSHYEDSSGLFSLSNCPQLKTIEMGLLSFGNFSGFSISNLPLLERMVIGDIERKSNNFYNASLQLRDFPRLSELSIGYDSFHESEEMVVEKVPELKEVTVGNWRTLHFRYQFYLLNITVLYSSNLPCKGSLTVTDDSQCNLLANGWSEITVNSGLCNDMKGDLIFFEDRCLKELVVKKNTFWNVTSVSFIDDYVLEKIEIKDNLFLYVKNVTITSTLIGD